MASNGTPEQSNDAPQGGGPAGGGGFTISSKMLAIGGGGIGAVALVVIIVVVLLTTGVFGGGGGGASGGSDLLAYVPGDAGAVAIADNRAVLNGNVPEDLIEYWEDDESGGPLDDFPDSYDDLDIDDDDVATFAFVFDEDGNDSLAIVQGDFAFDIVREDLEDGADCEDDDYRGFELWECPDGGAVALFEKDGYLVFAAEGRQDDLEQLLTDKSRSPEKLADADGNDIKEILSRTDGGWLQFAFIQEDCIIERCEGLAIAVGESEDSDAIPASYAVMFSSERAAAAAEGDVEIDDFLEEFFAGFDFDLDIGEVKAEGEFLVGTGTAEFVEPDDTSSRSSNPNSGGGSSRESARAQAESATQAPAAVRATNTPLPQPAQPAWAPSAPTPTARWVAMAATAAPAYPVVGQAQAGGNILAYVPGDAGDVLIVDNQAILNSNLPDDLIDHIFGEKGSRERRYQFPGSFDDLDIEDDHVATIAFVRDEDLNDSLTIVQGDFEFDLIRKDLEDGTDCEVIGVYWGGFEFDIEVWLCPDGGAVALFEKDSYLAFAAEGRLGDLEQLLTYKSDAPGKLADADDSNIKEILSRTGGGLSQYALVNQDCNKRSCGVAVAIGESDDSDSIPASSTAMFSSERAAAASEGDVEFHDHFEAVFRTLLWTTYGLDVDIGEVKAEGEFLVGSGTAAMPAL